jgi:hypothetical protein
VRPGRQRRGFSEAFQAYDKDGTSCGVGGGGDLAR